MDARRRCSLSRCAQSTSSLDSTAVPATAPPAGQPAAAAAAARAVIGSAPTARAGNRRFWSLSALRAHTKAPYKTDLYRKTLGLLNRYGTARTGGRGARQPQLADRAELLEDRADLGGGKYLIILSPVQPPTQPPA
jgi:hypothetical protein